MNARYPEENTRPGIERDDRYAESSLCCGMAAAGSDGNRQERKFSDIRLKQAQETGAEILAQPALTASPVRGRRLSLPDSNLFKLRYYGDPQEVV